ncbi:MAG TPA: hypothetical protein VN034_06535 [Sphingopyxis sp.]|nr:hypothetical protein [Sphingopyxis sp.]
MERLRAVILTPCVVGFFRFKVGVAVRLVHAINQGLNQSLKVRAGQGRD